MDHFENLHFLKLGEGDPSVFWAHGWGQSHAAFLPWAEKFKASATQILLDFPGHGASPEPSEVWGTEDYADQAARLIRAQTDKPIIWIGHSFGCRVGLQLAIRHPDLIAGLFLIAGAGIPRKRPLWHKIYYGARVKLFKALKKLIPLGLSQEWLYTKFGSRDYKAVSEAMRGTFVRVVNEDLSTAAESITCPVQLVYGAQDTETPPELGEKLHTIIPSSELIILENFDHYSILSSGQHQIAPVLDGFIESHIKA